MASRRKTPKKTAELSGDADPRAPLDGAALLTEVRPLLKELAADLLKRADDSLGITQALQTRHASDQDAKRTADAFLEWRRSFVEQVAAAWLLSCVFVRTLEDRQLLGKSRIAGPGALDSWKAFLQLAPSLSEREYLLTVFRELSRFPAATDLFDVRHNPVWLLAPSAEGARKLLELFRGPSAEAPTFRFGGADTRFLGDLYQDLSEDVRKRYALLQTPRFVEGFILDRTLEPAIERFGLDDTRLIDPTCGSGHFLLGAFERLFDHRLRAEPGLSPREAASKALDAVAGADINPYAVAIARFRLTLAFIEKCGLQKLKDVPRLPLHLGVADSLLYNPQTGQQLGLAPGTDPEKWEGSHFSLEDPAAARDVLFKTYAAVVGNPPYITVKDAVLRERYRDLYVSAAGKYSLAAPFAERFFQLARDGASVGMITANSFMKREFGKQLIEKYLPTVNLELIVNTSGAYIPGHGTPTVLLFGTREKPKGTDVLAVLASRGEPTTPDDPEHGLVWSSIAGHWSDVGFENEYISVARVERTSLAKHPWSLGGGGAGELKELLEERAESRLGDVAENIGFASFTGLDDAFIIPMSVGATQRIDPDVLRPMVNGEVVRDWAVAPTEFAITPYKKDTQQPLPLDAKTTWARFLWPYRSTAQGVASFAGKSREEEGQNWWEWYRWQSDRYLAPLRITFAFVATHNHFVLDRGGKVFNRSAPIIKLPETATEDDHLALLAYLNSSTACFWMKQVFYPKGSAAGDISKEKGRLEDNRYEFAGTGLKPLPIPAMPRDESLAIVRQLEASAQARGDLEPELVVERWLETHSATPLTDAAGQAEFEDDHLLCRMIALQEDLDWLTYVAFGLAATEQARAFSTEAELSQEQRPFSTATDEPPAALNENDRKVWSARWRALRKSAELGFLEQPTFKRRWLGARGVFASKVASYRERIQEACLTAVAAAVEKQLSTNAVPASLRSLRAHVSEHTKLSECATLAAGDGSTDTAIADAIRKQAVPFLSALTFTDSGRDKRGSWEAVWDQQRREDAGEKPRIAPPPKFDPKDYQEFSYWSLRGKLDVPKERFISYPGCESDEDKEPVYGWAGWDHLQRAVALAGLYQDRKQREGWSKERLLPMLAGLLELLPWLKQWHHEPSADLGGERPSDQFEAFLNAECAEHGFTPDHLRAWRPPAKGRSGVANPRRKRAGDDERVPE